MQVRKNKNGTVSYRVIYRTSPHGPRRVETFYDRDEALEFERDVQRKRRQHRMGSLEKGKETLGSFADRWWAEHVELHLQPRTRKDYLKHYRLLVEPHLGPVELRDFTVSLVNQWRVMIERQGVNPTTVRQAMVMLQGILSYAEENDLIAGNPARKARKPQQARHAAVPMVPSEVEAIRSHLLSRGDLESVAIVSLLCYAGLRPQELLALEWRHLRDRTLLVEQKNLDGTVVPGQKAKRPPRTVTLLSVLREDLEAWRAFQSVRPLGGPQLMFTKRRAPWRESAWGNWTQRTWTPALRAAGVEHRRPYDGRHSLASLRLWEGWSLVEVAAELGHSPTMCGSTYAHVLAELKEQPRVSAEQVTREARAAAPRTIRTKEQTA